MEKEGIEKILRKPELFARIQLSDASIWRLERLGKFPKRIKIGSAAVGWLESEVIAWLAAKAAERMIHRGRPEL